MSSIHESRRARSTAKAVEDQDRRPGTRPYDQHPARRIGEVEVAGEGPGVVEPREVGEVRPRTQHHRGQPVPVHQCMQSVDVGDVVAGVHGKSDLTLIGRSPAVHRAPTGAQDHFASSLPHAAASASTSSGRAAGARTVPGMAVSHLPPLPRDLPATASRSPCRPRDRPRADRRPARRRRRSLRRPRCSPPPGPPARAGPASSRG